MNDADVDADPGATQDDGDARNDASARRLPSGMRFFAFITFALCVFSVPTRHVGAGFAVVLLVAVVVLRRRGFKVTGLGVVGVLSLLIAVSSTYACYAFFPKETELDGNGAKAHAEEEGAFDSAFEKASAAPGSTTEQGKP